MSKLFQHRWLNVALGKERPRPGGGFRLHPSQCTLAFPRQQEGAQVLRSCHDEAVLEALDLDPDDGLHAWFRANWDVELETEVQLSLSWSATASSA